MRVALVSKALVTGIYRRLASEIGRAGVDLTVICPPRWRDTRGRQELKAHDSPDYSLRVAAMRLNGNFHLHHYPGLHRLLRELRPDLLHMDEEAYNLATWLALRSARRLGIPALFFTWQNLQRRYPPPFRWWERDVYGMAAHAVAGTEAASRVLRAKGFDGPVTVNPQMGVDTDLFSPRPRAEAGAEFVIGYAGGLLREKGVDELLQACAALEGDWRLQLAGTGAHEPALRMQASDLGIARRVEFLGRLDGEAMPGFYRGLDAFVLPSRTRSNWKEQFGRVLIEAMACEVPTVVSDSGEGRHVVGETGLCYPEADSEALTAHLRTLQKAPLQRRLRGRAGRARAAERFSMPRVAATLVEVYAGLLADADKEPHAPHRP